MTPFNYLTIFCRKIDKPLRRPEQLRSMALIKNLIIQSKTLGWTEQDFTELYDKVVDEITKDKFINSFGYIYGPLKGILDQSKPKMISSEGLKFDEEWIKQEVEKYKRTVLGG